jgi:hypothetical protein
MFQSQSPRVVARHETDQQMLEWLRGQVSHFSEGDRRHADSIVALFAELVDEQATFKRALSTLQDAHKLAMAQMQFAQSVVNRLVRHFESLQITEHPNGDDGESSPDIDLEAK